MYTNEYLYMNTFIFIHLACSAGDVRPGAVSTAADAAAALVARAKISFCVYTYIIVHTVHVCTCIYLSTPALAYI